MVEEFFSIPHLPLKEELQRAFETCVTSPSSKWAMLSEYIFNQNQTTINGDDRGVASKEGAEEPMRKRVGVVQSSSDTVPGPCAPAHLQAKPKEYRTGRCQVSVLAGCLPGQQQSSKRARGKSTRNTVEEEHPPSEKDSLQSLALRIQANYKPVANPFESGESDELFKAGQLVANVLSNLIKAVHQLLGPQAVVTNASILFFSQEKVPAQAWHLDYVPEHHPDDNLKRYCWKPSAKEGAVGSLVPYASEEEWEKMSLNRQPILLLFSFSDNYFLEYISGIPNQLLCTGISEDTLNYMRVEKKQLPFGSCAIFSPECVHRGPERFTEGNQGDPFVFRFHMYVNFKEYIRNETWQTTTGEQTFLVQRGQEVQEEQK